MKDEIIMRGTAGKRSVWVNQGRRHFPLTPEEQSMDAEDLKGRIEGEMEAGIARCTSCKIHINETDIAGYPLFAGAVCKKCWEKHLAAVEHQRKTGNCCLICGAPRLQCCC